MPTYRANSTDKQIEDVEAFYAHSCIPVRTDATTRKVGNPTGSGVNPTKTRRGVVEAASDKPQYWGDNVGKP